MNEQEILTKAVEKAIANGWDTSYITMLKLQSGGIVAVVLGEGVEKLIYNHDFARAVWGNGPQTLGQATLWKYHLANMVLADDPIKYLGENI